MLYKATEVVKSVEKCYNSGKVEEAFSELLRIIETQGRALSLYERERNRFKHANPEITGAYYLSGGYGERDDNSLPQYVLICPAYGVGWEQIYERTDRTVSYEGS